MIGNCDKILFHWSFPQGYWGNRWHTHLNPHTIFMFVTRDWQSVMHKCVSQTLWPSGMAQSMTQPSSTICTPNSHANKTAGRMVACRQRLRPAVLPYDLTTLRRSHTRTRNIIERSFGLLKQRFRCLDFSGGTMQFSPSCCCDIIVATVVLHNMCILDNAQLPDGFDVIQLTGSDDLCIPHNTVMSQVLP